jgi:hypothetical protein
MAQNVHLPHFRFVGRLQEGVPFRGRQVLAMTVLVVESIHAADLSSLRISMDAVIGLTLWPFVRSSAPIRQRAVTIRMHALSGSGSR